MPKDTREIIHGIRIQVPQEGHRIPQSKTLGPGMEDELAAMYTDKELKVMLERGDITGNWKSLKKGAGAAAESEDKLAAASKGDRAAADKTAATDRAVADKKTK